MPRERVGVQANVSIRVKLGGEIRVVDRERSPSLNGAAVLDLSTARAPRTASPAAHAVIDRRLPLVPAILTAPPRLAMRTGGHHAGIQLTVAGLMKLGSEIRTHSPQGPPPRHRTGITVSIARRSPEALPALPTVRAAS